MYALTGLTLVAFLAATAWAYSVYDIGAGNIHHLEPEKDVWLEGTSNRNNHQVLIVAKLPQFPNKRTLVQFEDLPASCTKIIWAKMYLYFLYAHRAGWHTVAQTPYISRPIQVHQVKVAWSETQATSINRQSGVPWSKPYLSLDCDDASAFVQDTVTIFTGRKPGYVEFDVTTAVKNWQVGDDNHGLLLLASNELEPGRDIRFASRENSDSGTHPALHVLCDY